MAPPQLSRNTPRLDVSEPMKIDFLFGFWQYFDCTITHRLECWSYDFIGVNKPLISQHRLNHDFGAISEGLHDGFIFHQRN